MANLSFINDALYCSEEEDNNNWEEELGEVVDAVVHFKSQPFFPPILLDDDDDDEICSLLSKQDQNQLEINPSLAESRRDAVNWMLRVNSHYSFTALTSVLAINFLDRFLFSSTSTSSQFHTQINNNPWMTQLTAVACLSLAAKVEETQVPLLLDLQVEDSKYVFEAKTIQRMELLVLSTLQWRMNPVTPLSFLHYITRRFGFKDYLCSEFIRRSELIVLSLISDCSSILYLPNVIAYATMLHVINAIEPGLGARYETQLSDILRIIDKEKANECKELIMELGIPRYYYSSRSESNKRKYRVEDPGSPNCVMDVSFSSSDSSNDSWAAVGSSSSSSVCSSPEQLTKKIRAVSGLNHENADDIN